MKITKGLKTVFLLSLFSIMISFTAEARGPRPGSERPWRNWNRNSQPSAIQPGNGNGNSVAVPLDGGLLALLAGAGITYFADRRKKKKEM